MNWTVIDRLSFVWWNTGLSPPVGKPTATEQEVDFVVDHIRALRAGLEFSVFGLGEVSSEILASIMAGVGDPSVAVVDTTSRSGRIKFDTALLYDRTKLELITHFELIECVGKSRLKLGQLFSFTLNDSARTIVYVITSHWLSRLYVNEFSSKRRELGMLLRTSIDKLRNESQRDYIVLMGDYNDDPFSPALAEHLLATRDRELARRNSKFFYNPFWRCLGESLPYKHEGADESVCGTHFYPNGDHTEWFTYDQIIFSSAFLDDSGPILLSEECTKIISTPDLLGSLRNRRHFCDHFPVVSIATVRAQT